MTRVREREEGRDCHAVVIAGGVVSSRSYLVEVSDGCFGHDPRRFDLGERRTFDGNEEERRRTVIDVVSRLPLGHPDELIGIIDESPRLVNAPLLRTLERMTGVDIVVGGVGQAVAAYRAMRVSDPNKDMLVLGIACMPGYKGATGSQSIDLCGGWAVRHQTGVKIFDGPDDRNVVARSPGHATIQLRKFVEDALLTAPPQSYTRYLAVYSQTAEEAPVCDGGRFEDRRYYSGQGWLGLGAAALSLVTSGRSPEDDNVIPLPFRR